MNAIRALTLVLAMVTASTAMAGGIKIVASHDVPGWRVVRIHKADTNDFVVCSMMADFIRTDKTAYILGFSMYSNAGLAIYVEQAGWRVTAGRDYRVTLSVDNGEPIVVVGQKPGVGPSIMATMPSTAAWMNQIRKGNKLMVKINDTVIGNFSLFGTDLAVQHLYACTAAGIKESLADTF